MAALIYSVCALAAFTCAFVLLRAYRRSGMRLLFWSGLCFSLLTLNNALITVDLLVIPDTDIFFVRNLSALLAIGSMLYGLVWEAK